MTRKFAAINISIALLAVALVAGCGSSKGGGGPFGPDCADISDWFGTYASVDSSYDCVTGAANAESNNSKVCYQHSPVTIPGSNVVYTKRTCTSTHLEVAGSWSESADGCTITTSLSGNGDRSGNNIVIRVHYVVTANGNCEGQEVGCVDHVLRGTRTTSDTTGCSASGAAGRHGLWAALPPRGR